MALERRLDRVSYLLSSAMRSFGAETSCPGCAGNLAKLVRRKYLVTSLYECPACHLRFRVPKDDSGNAERLYKKEKYRQGFTTTLPQPQALKHLLETRFAGTEKDFRPYIDVLRSLLPPDAVILDFGCSWGYGSWQMTQAGFSVWSYEISQERAQYAREHLACRMVDNLRALDGSLDCFFSAHVIEHLSDPNVLFAEAARLLAPGGYFLCYCPNGSPNRERADRQYHRHWGKVHPLLITPEFIRWACARNDLNLCDISAGANMDGPELLAVARRSRT